MCQLSWGDRAGAWKCLFSHSWQGMSWQAVVLPGRALGKAVVSWPLCAFTECLGPPAQCSLDHCSLLVPVSLRWRPVAPFSADLQRRACCLMCSWGEGFLCLSLQLLLRIAATARSTKSSAVLYPHFPPPPPPDISYMRTPVIILCICLRMSFLLFMTWCFSFWCHGSWWEEEIIVFLLCIWFKIQCWPDWLGTCWLTTWLSEGSESSPYREWDTYNSCFPGSPGHAKDLLYIAANQQEKMPQTAETECKLAWCCRQEGVCPLVLLSCKMLHTITCDLL